MVVDVAPGCYVPYYPASGETREEVAARFGVAPEAVEERGGVLLLPVPSPRLRLEGDRVVYVVGSDGESFPGLAARFLGNPLRWPLIWPLNRRRELAPGVRFASRPRRLRPGWALILPVEPVRDGWGVPVPPEEDLPEPEHPAAPGEAGAAGGLEEPGPEAAPEESGSPADAAPVVPAFPADLPANGTAEPDGLQETAGAPPPASRAGARGRREPAAGAGRRPGLGLGLGGRLLARRPAGVAGTTPAGAGGGQDAPGGAAAVGSLVAAAARAGAVVAACGAAGGPPLWPLLVVEAPGRLEVVAECPVGEAGGVAYLREELGRRLRGRAGVEVLDRSLVRMVVEGAGVSAGATEGAQLALVPAGARDGALWYLNVAAARGTVLAGRPVTRDRYLAVWLAALARQAGGELPVVAYGAAPLLPVRARLRPASRLVEDLWAVVLAPERGRRAVVADLTADIPAPERLEAALARTAAAGVLVLLLAEGEEPAGPGEVTVAFGEAGGVRLTYRRFAEVLEEVELPPVAPLLPPEPEQDAPDRGGEPVTVAGAERPESAGAEGPAVGAQEADVHGGEGGGGPEASGPPAVEVSGDDREEAPAAAGGTDGAGPAAAAPVRLRLLGTVRLVFPNGEEAESAYRSCELLAYLALRGGAAYREELVEALYPDQAAGSVGSVAKLAQRLRDLLEEGGVADAKDAVRVGGGQVGLAPGVVVTDVQELEAELELLVGSAGEAAVAAARRVVAGYRGPLGGAEPWAWIVPRRQQLHGRVVAGLLRGVAAARELGDPAAAAELALGVLAVAPACEEACREAMRAAAALGDPHGVRKAYELCEDGLRRLAGGAPSEETVRLYEELLARRAGKEGTWT